MMATYETTMLEDTMFELPEDTEMAVDAGKYIQHTEDIDIDLDFVDHAQQDEMMIEDSNEIHHDLELGDAIVEQDAEMTDESAEDELLDEEITDAPPEPISNEKYGLDSVSVIDSAADQTHTTVGDSLHEGTSLPPQVDNLAAEQLQAQSPNEESKGEIQAVPKSLVKGENTKTVENIDAPEEVEELITWESDEEEEVEDGNKVGESAKADPQIDTTGFQPSLEQTTDIASITQDAATNAAAQSGDEVQSSNRKSTVDEKDEKHKPEETITRDESYDDIEEGIQSEYGHVVDTHEGAPQAEKHDEIGTAEPDNRTGNDSATKKIEESALEQLHPIILRYMEQEMSLFPPSVEEEHTLFFLSEKRLAFNTCQNLFKAFRDVLGDNITENESLVLDCPDLGLEISETTPESSTLSIAQLLHLHLGLSHNDGLEQAAPMLLVLKHHHDVSARLNELYALMGDGKGFSSLSNHASLEVNNGSIVDGNGPGEVADSDALQEFEGSRGHEHETVGHEDGHATPEHKTLLDIQDDEPDFSSPAAVQKYSDAPKASNIGRGEEPDAREPKDSKPAVIEQAAHDEITYEDDEIDYEDDEVEDVHQISNLATEEVNQEPVKVASKAPSTANTNHEIDQEMPHNHATNDSEQAHPDEDTSGQLEHKNNLINLNGQSDAIGNLTSSTEAQETGSHASEVTNNFAKSAVDDPEPDDTYDEIGYSDDEEVAEDAASVKQILEVTAATPSKPSSPKRSIDEVDDTARDSKRLRAH